MTTGQQDTNPADAFAWNALAQLARLDVITEDGETLAPITPEELLTFD